MKMKTDIEIDGLPVYTVEDMIYADLVEELGTEVEIDDLVDWLDEWLEENTE